MNKRNPITLDEAKRIGDCLYVDWDQVNLEQFRRGLMGNRRRTDPRPAEGLDYDGVLLSGKTVLAHMRQIPDYIVRLAKLRAELHQYEVRRSQQNDDGNLMVEASPGHVEEQRD